MPDCNAEGVASAWQLPTLDEELQWSSTLVERATRAKTGMYKRTFVAEVAYILKRVEEDKAARLAEMEKAAKAGKGKGKAEDMSSSQGGSEVQTTEGAAEEELVGDNFAGLEALAAAATEFQEKEEVYAVAGLNKEWLAAGPQAPEHDPHQRTRRRAAARGAATSNPTPTAKRVKTTTKSTKGEVACRQSPRLAQTKASSAKQPTAVEAESIPCSGLSSSQSSSSRSSRRHAPQADEPELLEVVADIGRDAADEAVEIAATEGQDLGAGDAQGSLAVMEHSSEDVPVEEVVVQAKILLQTMDPLPSTRIITKTLPYSSSALAMVLLSPGAGASGLSLTTNAELDEELQCLLAPLYQRAGGADHSAAVAMDLSFMESMAAGMKEMQARHNQKWQALEERRESANKVDQKLKDKCLELRKWNNKQFKVLKRKQETLLMTREDVMAREARLVDHKASPDAREREISLREDRLEATLRAKDEDLEVLVRQRTKELGDKHGATLDALIADHAAQLKKLTEDQDVVSSAKIDLDRQVAKLNEDLARGAKEVDALKEGARQAEIHLADVQSQLSFKTQSLETANGNISDMKARIGTLERSAESLESRRQLLSKDLDTAKRLQQDVEDRLKNLVDLSNL
nr:uncharacterized protein LOC109779957 [Aegilops tauschii subsp. strangulata]